MTENIVIYSNGKKIKMKQKNDFTFNLSVDICEEGTGDLVTTIDLSEDDVKSLINYAILDILEKQVEKLENKNKENKKTKKVKENILNE